MIVRHPAFGYPESCSVALAVALSLPVESSAVDGWMDGGLRQIMVIMVRPCSRRRRLQGQKVPSPCVRYHR